jgi:hypothetical protein
MSSLTFPVDWGVSLIVTGDIDLKKAEVNLEPIHPRGFILMGGRDLKSWAADSNLGTCDRPGAIMVHEQVELKAKATIKGQMIIEDAASCSSMVTANEFKGQASVIVNQVPPIPSGDGSNLLSWSESSL